MPVIDVTDLLRDLSENAPCGPDLEYSEDYLELARLIQGTPDIEYGNMHQPAEEPDWKAVKALALRMLEQSRDLRLAVHLTCASLPLDGLSGLEDGLALIEGLLERHWDHVYPQLDPGDANDPTARINTLVGLDEKNGLIRHVALASLVDVPAYGRFCLRDIDMAAGEFVPKADEAVQDMAIIDAAFKAAALDELTETVSVLTRACDRIKRIEMLLTGRVGHARAIRFEALSQVLRRAESVVTVRLRQHPQWVAKVDAQVPEQMGGGNTANPSLPAFHEIGNRDDVVRLLDLICEYYVREDPASPVPLFLQRARRLVHMSFIEIMNDLSPQSLGEINHLAGMGNG
ncbi:type VI secretion-associated protein, ImpA family [Burkholderia ubonensis]|uniref:type VI secretion system protein TssA n=1 Tax=Burkholderia ubonensis TaxID=101571 RepID=UPI00075E8D24|nr:type VI secretion system protein TssA [Burkholderia ubonensis]KVO90356.1 type VI secretion-associated protein, ImpA family [Burkholderia ubonensis]KVR25634.1 type VI secretion-associated protein, ImpA family [Burkholderia ubonensis]KWD22523.1 type VI secretion-associated protein, ImpA family [Burkholderia ubonensis]KWD33567.1 type VI secretion-associated protein, ImpA family [Burkholderia ubonensis]